MYPTLRVPILPHVTLPLILPPIPYRLIVVGDIHGCLHELITLLHICDFPLPSSLVSIPEDFKVESIKSSDEEKQLYEFKFSSDTVDGSWLVKTNLNEEIKETSSPITPDAITLGKRKNRVDTAFDSTCDNEQMTTILIILGDLVNKGPFSAEVVNFLHSLELYCEAENKKSDTRKHFVYCLRGNHDEAAIRWVTDPNPVLIIPEKYQYVTRWSKSDIEWYAELPYTISIPSIDAVFLHAGIVPGHAVTEQLYFDLCCIRDVVWTADIGWRPAGHQDLPDQGRVAWASVYGQDSSSEKEPGKEAAGGEDATPSAHTTPSPPPPPPHIYFGHDARRGLQLHQHATGLDTGCCYGRKLSAMVLPSRKIFQVQARIIVNTFRRLDLLETFMRYYKDCKIVKQVQVVWSDQENGAPFHWIKDFGLPSDKYVFEIHRNNSLSNRFRPLLSIPTVAVLSIDDDLIIPCEDLMNTMNIWEANKRVLVGFSPRLHAFDIFNGHWRYLKWQHTWWNGAYSILLTKASILHRDYLTDFASESSNVLPNAFLRHIDKSRNCEDIAMAYVVAEKSRAAPVWVRGTVYEISSQGISSGQTHFVDRSRCLSVLNHLLTTGGHAGRGLQWVIGYQKAVSLRSAMTRIAMLLTELPMLIVRDTLGWSRSD
eukprot:gene29815-38969_t